MNSNNLSEIAELMDIWTREENKAWASIISKRNQHIAFAEELIHIQKNRIDDLIRIIREQDAMLTLVGYTSQHQVVQDQYGIKGVIARVTPNIDDILLETTEEDSDMSEEDFNNIIDTLFET